MTATPWGFSQTTRKIAPGIMSYTTASHGGIHLSKGKNALMPEYFLRDDGWYEEDCEWAKVCLCFWDRWFAHFQRKSDMELAKKTLSIYFPIGFSKHFPQDVPE